MSRWNVLAIAGMLTLGLLLLTGCTDNEEPSEEPDGSPTAVQTPATTTTPGASGEILTPEDVLRKDPNVTQTGVVRWGWMFEQSGPLAGFGEPAGDGILLAVEEINAAGGFQVGDTIYTIELVKYDTESDISRAIARATTLVRDDKVNVIWGPAAVGDPETTEITQASNVLHICPCPEREIRQLSSVERMQEEAPLAFQTLPAASKFLRPGARNTAQEHPEFETFATICANSEIGRNFCTFFEEAYSEAGFRQVGQEMVQAGTTDFRVPLTELRTNDPDILLNFVDVGPAQFQLLNQAVELDVGRLHIAVAVPYDIFEALVGPGIRDKLVSAGAAPRTNAVYTSEKAEQFFEEKYRPFKGGTLPPGAFTALLTYDPAYMLIAAMQRAGTVEDTTAIAEALEEVHFSGAGEDDYFFNARHIIISGNDSCVITGGAYQGCTHHPAPPEALE